MKKRVVQLFFILVMSLMFVVGAVWAMAAWAETAVCPPSSHRHPIPPSTAIRSRQRGLVSNHPSKR